MGGAMVGVVVGAMVGARSSEVRFVNRVAAQGSVILSSVGWDVERRGRDGRTRWSGADGVRGAVGGGRRRTDVGGGWFMVGNGVSPYTHVFSKHGVPEHVTSDRGSEFVSRFFRSLGTVLDMKLHFTS